MQRVLGIGGFFFRAKDPAGLAQWYEANLGINVFPATNEPWLQQAGPTVFAPFEADTDYFGPSGQQVMLNFRVADLDALLAQLREGGAVTSDEVMDSPEGRFAWVTDPEGNRIELWQPAPEDSDASDDSEY